jgi:hypothetical protein
MDSFEFKPNRAGIRALLSTPAVQADLLRRAEKVKAAAEPRFKAEDPTIRVTADVKVGAVRAGASIGAIGRNALEIERRSRILGGAIDAARD